MHRTGFALAIVMTFLILAPAVRGQGEAEKEALLWRGACSTTRITRCASSP